MIIFGNSVGRNLYRLSIILVITMMSTIQLLSCSCDLDQWCEFMESDKDVVMIKATAYDHQFNGDGVLLTYMNVDRIFRSDAPLTDKIVLVGDEFEGSCEVDVPRLFEIRKTYYIAQYLMYESDAIASNFDLSSIWHFSPHNCAMRILRIGEVNVKGEIAE